LGSKENQFSFLSLKAFFLLKRKAYAARPGRAEPTAEKQFSLGLLA